MAALDGAGLAAILKGIGAPVTADNLAALVGWERAEGGTASFNPFNTTLPEPGASSYNSVGVRNYVNEAQGIRATVSTLRSSYYTGVVAALRRGNDPAAVAAAVGASPWGTPNFAADIPNIHSIGGLEKLAASIPGATVSTSNPIVAGAESALGAAKDAVTSVPSGIDAIGGFFGRLTDPSVWLNFGFVLLGLVLFVLAIARLFAPERDAAMNAGKTLGLTAAFA